MKKEEKIKLDDDEYKNHKDELFDMYFVKNITITEIKNKLQLTKTKVSNFIYRLKHEFSSIFKYNEYYFIWSKDENYPTTYSIGIKGYSNKYENFTYRVLNFKK
jgi:hypothetical protein